MVRKIILLKCECQILHMSLSTADSKQVLFHAILFKVLSLGLLQSLCLGHLRQCDTNGNISLCVALPKVAKASMGGMIMAQNHKCFYLKNISSVNTTYGRK
jgi:hypothetical protein